MLRILLLSLILWSTSVLAQQNQGIPIPRTLSFGAYPPKSYTHSGGSIIITSPGHTDMYRAADHSYSIFNAPFLSFVPDPDFVLSAKITVQFRQKWDAGALLLATDSLHYIKFGFEKDYTLKNRVVSVVTDPYSDDCNSIGLGSMDVYYCMAKTGDMVLLYESPDGKSWYLVRELNFPMHGRVRLGFVAQSPVGEGCTVTFSQIRYDTKKVTDPYHLPQ